MKLTHNGRAAKKRTSSEPSFLVLTAAASSSSSCNSKELKCVSAWQPKKVRERIRQKQIAKKEKVLNFNQIVIVTKPKPLDNQF